MADTIKDYLVGIGFKVDDGGAQKADAALTQLSNIVKDLGVILANTAEQIKGLLSGLTGGTDSITETADKLNDVSQAAEGLTDSEKDAAKAAGDMADGQSAVTDAASSSAAALDKSASSAKDAEKAQSGAGSAADKLADAEKKVAGASSDASSDLKGASGSADKLGDALGDTASKSKTAADNLGGAAKASDNLGDKLGGAADSAKDAGRDLKKANDAAKLENAKKGSENVSNLDEKLSRVSEKLKTFAIAAVTFVIGSGIKESIVSVIDFTENLNETAKSMRKGVEETRAYQTALSVMGKTADEVKKSASLKETFKFFQLVGSALALPEAAKGQTAIKDLKDSFLMLKFVGNYALQWIIYKVQDLAGDKLGELSDMVASITDWLSSNMEDIATKVATGFGKVLQAFLSAIKFVKMLYNAIDSLPAPIKNAMGIALAAILLIKSKFALITAVVGAVLLLIDDFVTYMEGGDALFADFWGSCIVWAEKCQPYIDAVSKQIELFWQELQNDGTLKRFGDSISRIFEALKSTILKVLDTVTSLFTKMGEGKDIGVIFADIADAISRVVEWLSKAVEWMDEMGLLEPIIYGVVAALTALKGVKIVTSIAKAIEKFKAFGSVLGLAGGKIGLIIIAIGLLVAAGVWLVQNWDKVKAAAETVWNSVAGWVIGAWETIKSAWSDVAGWFATKFNAAKTAIQNAWNPIASFFAGIWDGIKAAFEKVSAPINAVLETIGGWAEKAKEWFKDLNWTLPEITLPDWVTNVIEVIGNWWTDVQTWFQGLKWELPTIELPEWVNGVLKTISDWWDKVVTWFKGLNWALPNIDMPAWVDSVIKTIGEWWEKVKGWFTGLNWSLPNIETPAWINTVLKSVETWWNNVKTWFKDLKWQLPEIKFPEWVDGVLVKVGEWWETIKSWFTGLEWKLPEIELPGWVNSVLKTINNWWVKTKGWFQGLKWELPEIKMPAWIDGVLKKIGEWWDKAKTWFKDINWSLPNIDLTKWIADIKKSFEDWWGDITGWFASLKPTLPNIDITAWIDDIQSKLGEWWNGISEWFGNLQWPWDNTPEPPKIEPELEAPKPGDDYEEFMRRLAAGETVVAPAKVDVDLSTAETEVTGIDQNKLKEALSGLNIELTGATFSIPPIDLSKAEIIYPVLDVASVVKTFVDDVISALGTLPGSTKGILDSLASNIKSAFSSAASSAVSSIGRIKSALNSIPKTVTVTITSVPQMGMGGVVTKRTRAEIGEDGKEYVIPVTKPSRAVSLIKSAAAELGMTVQSTRDAQAMLGGRADANVTPRYASPAKSSNTSTTNNNTQVSAPATINVYGSNANSIAQNVAKTQERLLVRNLKGQLA